MSYLVLARKWRPQVFEEVIGQDHVVKTLQNAIQSNRIAHAFLFTGQRGVGKTSIARILAKALNCEQGPTPHPCCACTSCKEIAEGATLDVLEIDGASNTGVNDVRELRESVKYVPAHGRYKIYIIDEVHMLSGSAFNALLKTLEEPPAHVIFMFATTEVHKIPATVLSRCQRFDLRRLSRDALVEHLRHIASQEGISISEKGLRWIARDAEGSMRDAQSIMDRVISYAGREIADKDIMEILGVVDRDLLFRASQAIVDKDVQACIGVLQDMLHYGYDVRQFYHAFLEHLRNMIMVKIGTGASALAELAPDECAVLAEQVQHTELETLQRFFDIWLRAEDDLFRSSLPQTVMEMLLVKMVYLKRLLPLDDALAKLATLERRMTCATDEGSSPAVYGESQGGNDRVPRARETVTREAKGPASPGDAPEEQPRTWEGFLAYARKEKPMLAALLDHGRLVCLDEKKLEVGFAPNSIYFDTARDSDNVKQLKRMGDAFFGRALKVAISALDKSDLAPSPALPNDAGDAGQQGDKNSAQHNDLLREAISLFDATIVEVKPGGGRQSPAVGGSRQNSEDRIQ